jgi:hypothetical protein
VIVLWEAVAEAKNPTGSTADASVGLGRGCGFLRERASLQGRHRLETHLGSAPGWGGHRRRQRVGVRGAAAGGGWAGCVEAGG